MADQHMRRRRRRDPVGDIGRRILDHRVETVGVARRRSRAEPPCPRQSNPSRSSRARASAPAPRYISRRNRPARTGTAGCRAAAPVGRPIERAQPPAIGAGRVGQAQPRRQRPPIVPAMLAGSESHRCWLRFSKRQRLVLAADDGTGRSPRSAPCSRCCCSSRRGAICARGRFRTDSTPRSRCSRPYGGGRTACRCGPMSRWQIGLAGARLRAVRRRLRDRHDGRRRRQDDRRAGAVAAAVGRSAGCWW